MSFFDKIGEAMACVAAPVDCAIVGSVNWLDAQSAVWVLAFGFIAGLILGALLGKPAVAALLAVGGALVFWRRSTPDTVEVPDEDPPHIKRLKQSQRKPVDPKSAYQKWIRGEE